MSEQPAGEDTATVDEQRRARQASHAIAVPVDKDTPRDPMNVASARAERLKARENR